MEEKLSPKETTKRDTLDYVVDRLDLKSVDCCRSCSNFRALAHAQVSTAGSCGLFKVPIWNNRYKQWSGKNLEVPANAICQFYNKNPSRLFATEFNKMNVGIADIDEHKNKIDGALVEQLDPRDIVRQRIQRRDKYVDIASKKEKVLKVLDELDKVIEMMIQDDNKETPV
jgi:hypothetical protein